MAFKIRKTNQPKQSGPPQGTASPPPPYPPPYTPIKPRMKTSVKILIGIVIAFVVVIAIGAVAFVGFMANYPSYEVSMEVLDSEWGDYNYYVEKYEYVVTVKLTNDRTTEVNINPYGFYVISTNGSGYMANPAVADTSPDSLSGEHSVTFKIGFLLLEDVVPDKLKFDYLLVDIECDIPKGGDIPEALRYDFGFEIADSIESGGFNYVAEEGMVYVVADLKISNNNETNYEFWHYEWVLLADGEEYEPWGQPLDEYYSIMEWRVMSTGESVHIHLWYEIPTESNPTDLIFVSEAFGGEVIHDESLL